MDLLTCIASEFNIPIIRKDQKLWFFRTKGGKFYYDFITNGFIALGWDLIPSKLITDSQKSRESIDTEKENKGIYFNKTMPEVVEELYKSSNIAHVRVAKLLKQKYL